MKAHSERVPGKNMRYFNGRPLFHWILESLTKSEVISEIIINTDSDEIAESALKNFNVTIHMRPDNLLDIHSNEAYQIMSYDLKNTRGEHFLQSHSTNPLLKPETINAAVEKYLSCLDKYDSLFTVTPLFTRLYDNNGDPINHNPHNLIKTQDLLPVYEENSCIYIFNRTCFFKNKNRIGSKPYLYPIDRYEAVDIDEEFDFLNAECIGKNI